MRTLKIHGSFTALLLFLFVAGAPAGQHNATLGVSVRVTAPHQPQLAQSLPLPLPGHLMQEDARGRHYFFDGDLHTARDYYLSAMQRRGYTLVGAHADDALSFGMCWERAGEVAVVQLRATAELAPTRISLLVMAE